MLSTSLTYIICHEESAEAPPENRMLSRPLTYLIHGEGVDEHTQRIVCCPDLLPTSSVSGCVRVKRTAIASRKCVLSRPFTYYICHEGVYEPIRILAC